MTNTEAKTIIFKEYQCVNRDCDIERSCGKCDLMMPNKEPILEAYRMAMQALEQEPCEDAISRQATLEPYKILDDTDTLCVATIRANILQQPPVTPQPEAGQFAKWVATEIFDENWEYNKDAFAEIACRKLAKLGIVRAKGDKWELVEPQESEKE